MEFSWNCACGQTYALTAADAGSTKTCECGAVHAIPSLRELRRQAGPASYGDNILGKLRALRAEGALPLETVCTRCGCETNGVLECQVEWALHLYC